MQLFLLALILALFVHDAPSVRPEVPVGGAATMLALLIVPKAILSLVYWLGCALTQRQLSGGQGGRLLRRLDWLTSFQRAALYGLFVIDLWAGALVWLRATVGDGVLIDELLLLAPTLATLVFSWWAYYPIDRRLREAKLIRRIDQGLPVYPIWSRTQFVISQLRHQMALLLVPLFLVVGWIETVGTLAGPDRLDLPVSIQMLLTLGGAGAIFVLAPLIIRHVWDTVPLPVGEMRERLIHMCEMHHVHVRELLLWRTYGGMINAAVMGLIAPLRYILLSDALLEQVSRDQVEAVMAHELAHVRKHHMPWLLAAAGGTLGLLQALAWMALTSGWLDAGTSLGARTGMLVERSAGGALGVAPWPEVTAVGLIALGAAAWFNLFGWVSRRFERQADAFAAVHLAKKRETPWLDEHGQTKIDAASAETMIGALQQVAELNNVPTEKKSWRHGAIAWRQDHLRSLIGRPVDQLPIDRVMRRIKLASAIAVAMSLISYALL
jgi:STE24 endopeptidase